MDPPLPPPRRNPARHQSGNQQHHRHAHQRAGSYADTPHNCAAITLPIATLAINSSATPIPTSRNPIRITAPFESQSHASFAPSWICTNMYRPASGYGSGSIRMFSIALKIATTTATPTPSFKFLSAYRTSCPIVPMLTSTSQLRIPSHF
jgi:hypothetical protein